MQAKELAEATAVPLSYMRKVLHELVRAGVLESTRGKHGGFRLAVAAEELPLLSVVSHFDQLGSGRRCVLGRRECSDHDPCPVHDRWKAAAEHVAAFFGETTVGDVLNDASGDVTASQETRTRGDDRTEHRPRRTRSQ